MQLIRSFVILYLLICITNSKTIAQPEESITVYGTVLNQKTMEAIPYANIFISNTGRGTISNLSGEFKIIIPAKYKNHKLSISFIGFEKLEYEISSLTGVTEYFLKEDTKLLDEVLIKEATAKSIVLRAIEKIPVNYQSSPFKSNGFYRVTSQRDHNYMHLSEAVFELYNADKNQFKLTKMRAIKDEKASHGLDLGLRAKSLFLFDLVNNLNSFDILNKKGLKNHYFNFDKTTTYDNREVFVISFDQKPEIKKSGYRGSLFIDVETYAFVRIEFGISPIGFRYLKFDNIATRALMELFDVHIAYVKNNYQINYKRINDKYYLGNAGNDVTVSLKSSRSHYDFLSDVRVDYLVTDIDIENIEPFSKEEILGSGKLIEDQNSSYDQAFWDDYNIILPNSDFVAISKKLEANNKANDFKNEIEDRIRKYDKDPKIRIDSILSFYNRKNLFNGNALIAFADEQPFQKSYNNKLTNNKNDSQFRIGSTSKTFTSMLIMMLENEGKLSLGDSVGQYIPDYMHGHVTIEQLLTHQSGIPNYTNNSQYLGKVFTKSYSTSELVNLFCNDSLEFTPGSQFQYSNSGFVLLSLIIEKITSKTYGQVLEEKILGPLEMKDTYFGEPNDTAYLVKGYLYGQPEPPRFIQNLIGAGGIRSTTEDLLKWSNAIETNKLLPKEKLKELFIGRVKYTDWEAEYGYGWMLDNYMFRASKRHKINYHPGTSMGFYSMFLKQPDENITIILLSNTGDFPRFEITDLILNELN